MPIVTEMAGVNMRLEAGAIRELHWHTSAEWAYVLKGSTQITTVTSEGQNYVAILETYGASLPDNLILSKPPPTTRKAQNFLLVGAITSNFSKVIPTQFLGGTIKTADSRSFKAAEQLAVAEVTVEPGAMRELHWHPTQPEWAFFIEGYAIMTLLGAQSNARTFDFQAGDVGYVPPSFGHYVENTGNTTLHFLEIYKSDRVQDISLMVGSDAAIAR
ncbi:hypothetical protein EUX98_g997 [Antrodiella citrinella]|uniref:Cupin type-1 domain-containing protein n=1 Tax=Antrodiella citrinella TaxID=2447956 RepID=A0A4S4N2N2_9APHY|nr:hypothetical protein EUX98_g997 [Antrodiella citrinella]